MKKIFSKEIIQTEETGTIVRFFLCGGATTGIDFIIYMLIYERLNPLIAKPISSGIAMVCSFFLNQRWTFRYGKNIDFALVGKFIISQTANLATNTSVNYIILMATNNVILSFICATGCGMIVNYLLQRFLVFKNERGGS